MTEIQPLQTSGQITEREAIKALYKAADIYQATVRPHLHSEGPDQRRVLERQRALLESLLAALGDARRFARDDARQACPHAVRRCDVGATGDRTYAEGWRCDDCPEPRR